MSEIPNQIHERISPAVIDGVPSYLQMNAIEGLRTRQYEVLNQTLQQSDNWEQFGDEDERAVCEKLVSEQLETAGLNPGDKHYDEAKSLLMSVSVHEVPEAAWRGTHQVDGSIHSRRHGTYQRLEESFKWNDTDDNSDQQGTKESTIDENHPDYDEARGLNKDFDKLNNDLAYARGQMALTSSKRLGKAFSLKSEKRDQLKDKYQELVRERGKWALDNNILFDQNDTHTTTEKNAAVIAYLFDEQKQLREKTIEELKKTKVSRFVEWMAKGNRATRIAKGVGIGVAAGVGGSLIAGFAGAGIVAGGAVGLSRFVKGYAAKDKHRGSKMATDFDDIDKKYALDGADKNTVVDVDNAHNNVNGFFEKDISSEQKERRKALAIGAASVGAGVLAGYGLTKVVDVTGNGLGEIKDWWNGLDDHMDNGSNAGIEGLHGPNGDLDGDNIRNSFDNNVDGDDFKNGNDPHPFHVDTGSGADATPDMTDSFNIPYDARWVETGEGWYQTFQELGIPENHWQDTLENAGPQLQEQGWAYQMDDGTWGISHQGRLNDAALRTIANSARRDGFTLAS